MKYVVKADRFLLENEVKESGFLLVHNGRFSGFVDAPPDDAVVEDWGGYTIAPGLFDTHIHGIRGVDVMDGTTEAIEHISTSIAQLGVTRFLPTTLTAHTTAVEQAITAIREAVETGLPGAQSEGVFLEGPYFSEKHKGAQNANYFSNPSYDEFMRWQALANGHIVKIALAPEREGAMDFIRQVRRENVHIGIAHSEASYDCCSEAVDAGVTTFVHLFNGMSGLHHRNPGVVGAAFTLEDTFAELICDGHHVHPDVAAFALRVKGEQLVLITDCMRAGGMPDGTYALGEYQVTMEDGIARTESGSLAGSTLTLLDAIKNARNWTNRPLHEIWHLGSLSPAKSVGKEQELGSIDLGKRADFVVLDNELQVQATVIDGIVQYQKAQGGIE